MLADVRASKLRPSECASFHDWAEFFRSNTLPVRQVPWNEIYVLSEEERSAISGSIQQFQLGEGADGNHFRTCADRFCRQVGERDYPEALALFIAEEQRHSADLGRFMDRHQIPRIDKHWVDGSFRRLRKLAGLEICVIVLVTAEIIAVPFYRALRGATESRLLRALCSRILSDEAAHLQFQADAIAMFTARRGSVRLAMLRLTHRWFLFCAALIVWQQHRRVFRRAGRDVRQLCRECLAEFRQLHARISEKRRTSLAALQHVSNTDNSSKGP